MIEDGRRAVSELIEFAKRRDLHYPASWMRVHMDILARIPEVQHLGMRLRNRVGGGSHAHGKSYGIGTPYIVVGKRKTAPPAILDLPYPRAKKLGTVVKTISEMDIFARKELLRPWNVVDCLYHMKIGDTDSAIRYWKQTGLKATILPYDDQKSTVTAALLAEVLGDPNHWTDSMFALFDQTIADVKDAALRIDWGLPTTYEEEGNRYIEVKSKDGHYNLLFILKERFDGYAELVRLRTRGVSPTFFMGGYVLQVDDAVPIKFKRDGAVIHPRGNTRIKAAFASPRSFINNQFANEITLDPDALPSHMTDETEIEYLSRGPGRSLFRALTPEIGQYANTSIARPWRTVRAEVKRHGGPKLPTYARVMEDWGLSSQTDGLFR